jgi:hypothetical protein
MHKEGFMDLGLQIPVFIENENNGPKRTYVALMRMVGMIERKRIMAEMITK